jgi:hypothetical protein
MPDLSLDNWRIWYEMVWAVVYLVPSDTRVLEIYLLKNIKSSMMSSCMIKLKFLPQPYIIHRLGKTSTHICCLLYFELSHASLMPYERSVMLLKSRSRTHHPHMHYSYIRGRHKNMAFHLNPSKKYFTSTLGVNTKNIPHRISPE